MWIDVDVEVIALPSFLTSGKRCKSLCLLSQVQVCSLQSISYSGGGGRPATDAVWCGNRAESSKMPRSQSGRGGQMRSLAIHSMVLYCSRYSSSVAIHCVVDGLLHGGGLRGPRKWREGPKYKHNECMILQMFDNATGAGW